METLAAKTNDVDTTVKTLETSFKPLETAHTNVLKLQKDRSDVKYVIQGLRECPAVSFPRFRELPPELQDQIWKTALRWPRKLVIRRKPFKHEETDSHIESRLDCDMYSTGLRSVCFSPKLHRPFFKPMMMNKDYSTVRKVFPNALRMTKLHELNIHDRLMYIIPFGGARVVLNPCLYLHARPTSDVVWFLGSPRGSMWLFEDHYDSHLRFVLRSLSPGRILKLAVTLAQWEWELNHGLAGFMSSIEGVQELIIVANPTYATRFGDLIFVEPDARSRLTWPAVFSARKNYVKDWYKIVIFTGLVPPEREIKDYSWSDLATFIV